MNTTLKFDKVILVKELNEKFRKVGEVFEIANILNDNSFLLRDAKTKIALGVVSFEDFEKCFVSEGNFKGWTDWVPFAGFDGQCDCFYKTNRKKVIVKFITDKVRAESNLHRDDEFNLHFGIQLAYLRCLNKALNKKYQEKYVEWRKIEHEFNEIAGDIVENNNVMKKMINSLNK